MLNFIRFDMKKLFKMKATWVTLLMVAAFMALGTFIEHCSYSQTYEAYETSMTKETKSDNVVVVVEVQQSNDQPLMSKEEFQAMKEAERKDLSMQKNIIRFFPASMIFVYILIAIFIGNDFSSGYLKNMLAIKGARWKWVTSKFAVAALIFFMVELIIIGFSYFDAKLAGQLGQAIVWKELLSAIGMQAILVLVIFSFLVTLSLILQSKTSIIVIATLMGMGLHLQIIKMLDDGLKLKLSDMVLSNKVMAIGMAGTQLTWQTVAMGLMYILGLYILSRWLVYRIDFKFEH